MPKENNAGATPTVDKAFYEKLKAFKKRIIKRWLRQYYQKLVWASAERSNSMISVLIDKTFEKPELCVTMFGLYKSALNYFDFDTDWKVLTSQLLALHKLYDKTLPNLHIYMREVWDDGAKPKLNKTQAMRELLARGFVHPTEVVRGWDKEKYSVVPISDIALTWPHQFDYQQDGIQFLQDFGIPGYMGCPSPEQGQLALYKRY